MCTQLNIKRPFHSLTAVIQAMCVYIEDLINRNESRRVKLGWKDHNKNKVKRGQITFYPYLFNSYHIDSSSSQRDVMKNYVQTPLVTVKIRA